MSRATSCTKGRDGPLPESHAALLALLRLLAERGYHFVTPTPTTHARVLARAPGRMAADLRDVFGWSLPFRPGTLDDELMRLLDDADAIEAREDGALNCRYRVSALGSELFLHSAYPTVADDAVFFGPDSYRFADLVRHELTRAPPPPGSRLVDIGAGAGVGGIVAAKACPGIVVTLSDVNAKALRLARINAGAAGVRARYALGRNLNSVPGRIDLVLANPPYIADQGGREYRDGGDSHGGGVAREMAEAALDRLSPGGRLILYSGSAIVGGVDALRGSLADLAAARGCTLRYREIDPDVFGEELDSPAYDEVERIALIAAIVARAEAGGVDGSRKSVPARVIGKTDL